MASIAIKHKDKLCWSTQIIRPDIICKPNSNIIFIYGQISDKARRSRVIHELTFREYQSPLWYSVLLGTSRECLRSRNTTGEQYNS